MSVPIQDGLACRKGHGAGSPGQNFTTAGNGEDHNATQCPNPHDHLRERGNVPVRPPCPLHRPFDRAAACAVYTGTILLNTRP